MYASGLMSLQTPIWAVAGTADTARNNSENAIIPIDNFVFRIGDNHYS